MPLERATLFAAILALALISLAHGGNAIPKYMRGTIVVGSTNYSNNSNIQIASVHSSALRHPPVNPGSNIFGINKADSLPLSGVSLAPPSTDEQIVESLVQNFSSIAVNVSAVEQSANNTYGPAYILNGLSNKGYWYQVGLTWNWAPGSTSGSGFRLVYEIWNNTTNSCSIYPVCSAALVNFSGPVNPGDKILLNMYVSSGNVVMTAFDWNTGANSTVTYSAVNATRFVGNQTSYSNNFGYFTGFMTEQYHPGWYNGTTQPVTYNVVSNSVQNAWLLADEFNINTGNFWLFCGNNCSSFPLSNSQTTLSFNGAIEKADQTQLVTGNFPLTVLAPTVLGNEVTRGQSSTIKMLNGNVINSTLPFNYSWLEKAPNGINFTVAKNCNGAFTSTCLFSTNSLTPLGTYSFRVQVIGSASAQQNSGLQLSPIVLVNVSSSLSTTSSSTTSTSSTTTRSTTSSKSTTSTSTKTTTSKSTSTTTKKTTSLHTTTSSSTTSTTTKPTTTSTSSTSTKPTSSSTSTSTAITTIPTTSSSTSTTSSQSSTSTSTIPSTTSSSSTSSSSSSTSAPTTSALTTSSSTSTSSSISASTTSSSAPTSSASSSTSTVSTTTSSSTSSSSSTTSSAPTTSSTSTSTSTSTAASTTIQQNQSVQQIITALKNNGFTNVSANQSIASSELPGIIFAAFDKNAHGSEAGANVLVLGFPSGYQYKTWNSSSPTTYMYINLTGAIITGGITFKGAAANSFFGGKSSGTGLNWINWKEIIPAGTIAADIVTSTTNSTTQSTTILSNTTTTNSTTTISNGGGGIQGSGGGGGGGGGAGSSKPVITNTTSGFTVNGIAQLGNFGAVFCGTQYHVTDNYITPNYTGLTINGTTYTLYLNKAVALNAGGDCYVELMNVSYLPILQTVKLEFFTNKTAAANPISTLKHNSTSSTTTSINQTTTATTTLEPITTTIGPLSKASPIQKLPASTSTVTVSGSTNPTGFKISGNYEAVGIIVIIVALIAIIAYSTWPKVRAKKQ